MEINNMQRVQVITEALPYIKIKQDIPNGISCLMVRRKGLEPPTYWFVASHSIQLSYRRIPLFSSAWI